MPLRSPPCYLGMLPVDLEWTGAPGAKQWAHCEGWRLEVEPKAGVGWRWFLSRDGVGASSSEPPLRGIIEFEEAADCESEAKRRAAEALAFAQEDGGP